MRGSTDISASMLDNLAHNHAHRNPTASLYELGTIYTPAVKDGKADPDVLPHEEKILTLGSYGRLSFFQFKGAIEALLRELNIKGASFAPEKANPSYHPGRCAKVLIDGKEIGVFGTIHPTVAARYGLSGEVLAAELRMDALLAAIDPEKLYHPLPKFPASTRDIAVLVDDAVPAASMQAAVEKAAGKLLEAVKLFDVYKGKACARPHPYRRGVRQGDACRHLGTRNRVRRSAARLISKHRKGDCNRSPFCISGAGTCLCRGWKKILLEFSAE